jgi:hypothetical protein
VCSVVVSIYLSSWLLCWLFGKFPYTFGSFVIMSHPQSWHLSQQANKASGVCSVCLNVRQLHLKDGLVHRHGPRHQPCAGSNKPPLADSVSQTEQKSQHVMASACLPVLVANGHSSASDMVSAPLNEVSYTASETCSFASTPSEIFSHERPAWLSSYCNPGIIKHIPKSARSVCATHLAGLFNRVVSNSTDIERWHDILGWPKAILFSPKRGGKRHNVASEIKKRISSWTSVIGAQHPLSHVVATDSSHRRSPSLAEAVSAKIEDGNIKAAIRIISSDEQLVLPSVDTLAALQGKHPAARQDSVHIPDPQPDCQLVMDENIVLRTLRSFPAGSSGGPDGLRPQHLIELVCCKESGSNLLASLTAFVNLVLSGSCPSQVTPLFWRKTLCTWQEIWWCSPNCSWLCFTTADCQMCCFFFRGLTSHIFQSSSVRHWYLWWM